MPNKDETNIIPPKGRVIIATLPNGSFGSAGQSWLSLDITRITEVLEQEMYITEVVSIDQLMDFNLNPQDIVFYTSSDKPAIRKYIRDVMYFINKRCRIIPRYELLLAHEDKGFQELAKAEGGFGNLPGTYHYDLNSIDPEYPYVFKTLTGAGSSGVELVRTNQEKQNLWRRLFRPSLKRRAIMRQRKFKLSVAEYAIYHYLHAGYASFVKQSFIKGLKNDYKILVFGDSYYALIRHIRENDFRASGSGNFVVDAEVPPQVLDFSKDIFHKMDAPFASLDVALSDGGCHLIEYQALNFGPIALSRSSVHYELKDRNWMQVANTYDLSEAYANALVLYLDRSRVI